MSNKRKRDQKPQKSPLLPGLAPGMRMKGGVRYDPAVKGFVAIVHTWDNVLGSGEPQEWRAAEVFPTEEAALHYYKTNIRPALEQLTAQLGKSGKGDVLRRKLEP